jgi:hypothetical protein
VPSAAKLERLGLSDAAAAAGVAPGRTRAADAAHAGAAAQARTDAAGPAEAAP